MHIGINAEEHVRTLCRVDHNRTPDALDVRAKPQLTTLFPGSAPPHAVGSRAMATDWRSRARCLANTAGLHHDARRTRWNVVSTPGNNERFEAPYLSVDLEDETWDAVVIGTGMGGATAGMALAAKGRRVLFLEKGHFLFGDTDRGGETEPNDVGNDPESRLRRGWWPEEIEGRTSFGPEKFFAPLGCGSGGTTGVYSAQLERFQPVDFLPRNNYPHVSDSALPEAWPIRYDELLPYYRRAEQLYRVSGTQDPLYADPEARLREPPPASERDQELAAGFDAVGLHTYRSHIGFEHVPNCGACPGTLCPRACKSDAGRISLMPALVQHGAKLLPRCEVLSLEADSERVQRIRCSYQGREITISGRMVVLAAGTLMTPTLLLRSRSRPWPNGLANRSGQVGRNLMFHAADFVAVGPKQALPTEGARKALSFNDFYVDKQGKLGTFQSMGIHVESGTIAYSLRNRLGYSPDWMKKLLDPVTRVTSKIASVPLRGASVFSTIVEDLPYAHNRVSLDPSSNNGMRFEYRYPEELGRRVQLFRSRLGEVLKPRHRMMVLNGPSNLNYGHMCGTCRFGEDPEASVLDASCRAHDLENLYVVDASFFPSSGGTNPALTVAANALRVADAIDGQLG